MLEEQALDRVHRIGQTKPVTTIRYIIKDSFEEVRLGHLHSPSPNGADEYQNIRNMQIRKKDLADLSTSQSRFSSADLSESRLEAGVHSNIGAMFSLTFQQYLRSLVE